MSFNVDQQHVLVTSYNNSTCTVQTFPKTADPTELLVLNKHSVKHT